MANLNNFWKAYMGQFWYFDVSKESGEKNNVFWDCAKSVCWLLPGSTPQILLRQITL